MRICSCSCIQVQGQCFSGGMKIGVEADELECKAMLAAVTLAQTSIMLSLNQIVKL